MNNYFKTNQSLWDQKTGIHKDSEFYQMDAFKKGATSLQDIELNALSDKVVQKSLLHLQCHFGQDSLSFARMGAKVTGIDFSSKAISLARELNDELGLDAEFVESNIYDLPQYLEGQFDIVFTSYGTIVWLPDLQKWADIIYQFLKPGGIFYIVEFHPAFTMYDHEKHQIGYRYFGDKEPYFEIMEGTYADRNAPVKHGEYFWSHSLHEVIQPLLKTGLQLVDFQEFKFSPYNCYPHMKEVSKNRFVYGDLENRLPHVFSLEMVK